MTDPIARLEADLAALAGPTARLHRIAEFSLELEYIEQAFKRLRIEAIRDARREGLMKWREIGAVLGVSLQYAHELVHPKPKPAHPSLHRPKPNTERTRT